MVTPARPLLRNTPASLFRQTGRTDYTTIKPFHIWSRQRVYLMSLLSRSNSQSSRCFLHFGVRSSDTSICAHAPKCFEQSGEKRTREETSSACFFLLTEANSASVQYLDDSDWTNSFYASPTSGVENTSFFNDDMANLSSALLKEDDPGEAGGWNETRTWYSSQFEAFLLTLSDFFSGRQSFPRVPCFLSETLFFCGVWAAGGLSEHLPGKGGCERLWFILFSFKCW